MRPILIVEDDEPTQALLRTLMKRSGYDVVVVPDGQSAIETLRDGEFAAVLLDLMMPAVTGRDVIAFLAAEKKRVPVIVCTASRAGANMTFDADVVRAVVRKPFDIQQLMRTVSLLAGDLDQPSARVLIVDDDTQARYILRAFLPPAHDSIEASSGEVALSMIREHPPDAVLLDLLLPGTSGEQVLDELMADPATKDIPVVVVTSRALSDDDRARLMRHAVGIIYKGDLSRQTLAEMLGSALSRG